MESHVLMMITVQLMFRVAHGKLITTTLVNNGASTKDTLGCAFKYVTEEYAGIQIDDTNGACGPLIRSDIVSGSLPNAYYVKTTFRMVYREEPSLLDLPLPVPVNVGAEFEFKVHGNSRFSIDLSNSGSTNIILRMSCQNNFVALNTKEGDWLVQEQISEDLTDDRTVAIKVLVTSQGFEISFDGIYMCTYNHRLSFSEIDHVVFSLPPSVGRTESTMSEQNWWLPQ